MLGGVSGRRRFAENERSLEPTSSSSTKIIDGRFSATTTDDDERTTSDSNAHDTLVNSARDTLMMKYNLECSKVQKLLMRSQGIMLSLSAHLITLKWL